MDKQNRAKREAVKNYLRQYGNALDKKRILEERRRVLSYELSSPATRQSMARAPRNKRTTKTDGAVSIVYRIDDVDRRIEQQAESATRAVLRVMDLIDLLPEQSLERQIVELRHIDCMPWDAVARAAHISRSRAIDYYNAAIDLLLTQEYTQKIIVE